MWIYVQTKIIIQNNNISMPNIEQDFKKNNTRDFYRTFGGRFTKYNLPVCAFESPKVKSPTMIRTTARSWRNTFNL